MEMYKNWKEQFAFQRMKGFELVINQDRWPDLGGGGGGEPASSLATAAAASGSSSSRLSSSTVLAMAWVLPTSLTRAGP